MKIPKSLKIAGQTVPILWGKKITLKGVKCLGLANLVFKEIYLVEKYKGRKRRKDALGDTFLHEIVHVVNKNVEAGLSERNVERLGHGLFQVLHDNKLRF